MRTSLPTENTSDDLDLIPQLVKATAYFRRFGKVFVVLSLLGFLIGCLIYKLLPKSYKATLVLQSSVLSNQQGLEVIDGWNGMLNRQGRPSLAQFFGVGQDTLKKLYSIKTTLIIGGATDESGISIEAESEDSSLFPAFQRGMLHALETNPYIEERVSVRKQNLLDQIAQSEQELHRLDSMKPYLRSFSDNEKDPSGKLILDVSQVSRQRLDCVDRIATEREKLQFLKAAYVLQGFVSTKTGKILPAPVLPLAGLLLGFLLAYVFMLTMLVREQLRITSKPATT